MSSSLQQEVEKSYNVAYFGKLPLPLSVTLAFPEETQPQQRAVLLDRQVQLALHIRGAKGSYGAEHEQGGTVLDAAHVLGVYFAWAQSLRVCGLRRHGTRDLATVLAANMAPGQWWGFRAILQRQVDPELETLRRPAFWRFVLFICIYVASAPVWVLIGPSMRP